MQSNKETLMELLQHDSCPLFMVFGELEGLADYLIANGVAVQKWIPVAERLPVLTVDRWNDEDGTDYSFEISDWVWGITTEGTQARVRYETGSVFQGWYEEDGKNHNITHWMLLPEAQIKENK